jgi:hypothetical protein
MKQFIALQIEKRKEEKNAEFFELISAINLASLLKAGDPYIVNDLLHMPDKYKNILPKTQHKPKTQLTKQFLC